MSDVAVGEERVQDRGARDQSRPGDVDVARVADPYLHDPDRPSPRTEDRADDEEAPDRTDQGELAPAAVANRAAGRSLVDALLDQLLPHLALLGHPEEEPGERHDGDESPRAS